MYAGHTTYNYPYSTRSKDQRGKEGYETSVNSIRDVTMLTKDHSEQLMFLQLHFEMQSQRLGCLKCVPLGTGWDC